MELIKIHPALVAIFFSVAIVGIQAGYLCPEDYWKSMLPETPMTNALKELLPGQSWRQAKIAPANTVAQQDGSSPLESRYFMEQDLRPGKKMTVQFTDASKFQPTFLPRHDADSIPFSSTSLPEVFRKFSVAPDSDRAAAMKTTVDYCERMVTSDQKTCANSLESMVDFSTSKMGRHVQAISTDVQSGDGRAMKEYSVVKVEKMKSGDEGLLVPCHLKDYAYAMFYCHTAKPTVAYKALMVAADGSKVEAVATCHQDTSKWNTRNLAFKVLKVKPGEGTVCHFVPTGDVVWVGKC